MRLLVLTAALGLCVLSGCRSSRPLLQSLPEGQPAPEYAVTVPDGYEVRSVGFGASYSTSVSGGAFNVPVSGSSTQQPYVTVHAVETATGQHVLLVYGDVRRRQAPALVIHVTPEAAQRATGG